MQDPDQRKAAFNTRAVQGQSIGAMDLLIAAHALALNVRLITHNVREFGRVPGLRVETWE
jgi:tRNA(fMet)-specific endonuclease VapC